ncbi:hypothetical protein ACFWXM_15505 [Achromobacter xylosoxidans]|uniref:hypothetical protein n=1 Tax=Alcaligenes xylosoxydans xylosoxydans TaxID=85698 RepID=UPI002E1761A0|nr:hypothetical protein [Achromobacter xylosoxidans]
MPRSDSALPLLALTVLAIAPGLADAACEPLAASSRRHTQVADISLDDQNTLLAMDGSRLRSWLPSVAVETGVRATPVIWAERVDWSVYAAAPGARIGETMLRWETSADDHRRLCGIARYGAGSVQQMRASGQPMPPRPEAETRFYYDENGRLIGYEERRRAWDGTLGKPDRYCLRYDEYGWLAELGANSCNAKTRPVTRYVHDATGRLLRTLKYDAASGEINEVSVYDRQGRPARRYLRDAEAQADGSSRLGPPYLDSPGQYPVMVLPGPTWQPPRLVSYHYDWAIVQPEPGSDVADVYGAKRDAARILAKGNSGDDGRFALTPLQRKRIWEAAGQTPGGVQWLWAPGQVHTLLQAMPAKTWAACTAPDNRQPDACEAR